MGTELVPLLMKNVETGKLLKIDTLRNELDSLMSTKLLELTPERVKQLMEDVMRDHLGWLIVWGNVFGTDFKNKYFFYFLPLDVIKIFHAAVFTLKTELIYNYRWIDRNNQQDN